jgi:rSAM/selenodomain-associated transferase 1
MKDSVIIVMAKQPVVGKTKTRLYPALSLQEAADLYQALLMDTIERVSNQPWADLAVAITPPESRRYFEQITPSGTLLLPVEGRDIGECLRGALNQAMAIGYSKALALNSDGPSLSVEYLGEACAYLEQVDVVFGPGEDGGYYLVGVKQVYPALFEGIAWSTEQVLSQTLERVARSGLSVKLTPPWYDVDTYSDLLRLIEELDRLPLDRLVNLRRFLADVDIQSRLE